MITAWFAKCKDEQEKSNLKNSILGSRIVLRRLDEMLVDEADRLDRSETNVKTYDNPNWASLQAHKNGYRSALEVVRNLIKEDQPND